jgi:DNA polymerase delta subunit 1
MSDSDDFPDDDGYEVCAEGGDDPNIYDSFNSTSTYNKYFDNHDDFRPMEAFEKYKRPNTFDPCLHVDQGIKAMLFDVDYQTKSCDYDSYSKEAVIRIFILTGDQHSGVVYIHGFKSYLWVRCPVDESGNSLISKESLRQEINNRLRHVTNSNNTVTIIEEHARESIMYYKRGRKDKYLKIFVDLPTHIVHLRELFEKGLYVNGVQFEDYTFESNIPFALRFMIDRSVSGMSWLMIRNYSVRAPYLCETTCSFELECSVGDVSPLEESTIAPLRILSFDIECSAEFGMPQPNEHPIIQIANICVTQNSQEPLVRIIFVLGSCPQAADMIVHTHKTETQLLQNWFNFVRTIDPDLLTGYNIINFDLHYIITRASFLKIPQCGVLGRVRGKKSISRDARAGSKQVGFRETQEINIEGRLQFDMFVIMHIDHKLSSYSLNNVATHFLKKQKEDVHHTDIYRLQNKDAFSRLRLAIYCMKDAELPLLLMTHQQSLYSRVAMARVTGVPIGYLFTKGQQIKVASKLYREAMKSDFIIPNFKKEKGSGGFEGAYVVEPKPGFYKKPIATLDFASLYPSIMMAHNLCYSTLIRKCDLCLFDPSEYVRMESGECFIKPEIFKGILPQILNDLVSSRSDIRKRMEATDDANLKAILNGQQLAAKITANSVYGFTGAVTGYLPCIPISLTVTKAGQAMIKKTIETVIKYFSKANDYAYDCTVIYGDTDSVMILFGYEDVAKCMELGKLASKLVSSLFIKPIKLEFEKVYYPYLLLAKKRYAGVLWVEPTKWKSVDKKGIESVRRDNCLVVRNVINRVLNKILLEQDIDGAVKVVHSALGDLMTGKTPLDELVITKSFSKNLPTGDKEFDKKNADQQYKTKTVLTSLIQKDFKRTNVMTRLGTRVAYIIIKGAPKSKFSENGEDPIRVLEENLPIDYDYYIQKQLRNPLLRLFEHIIPDASRHLFSMLNSTSYNKPKLNPNSAMGKFIKVVEKCIECGCKISSEDKNSLCDNCRTPEVLLDHVFKSTLKLKSLEDQAVFTQCHRCQGTSYQEIICSNRDCALIYKRVKVNKEAQNARKEHYTRFPTKWEEPKLGIQENEEQSIYESVNDLSQDNHSFSNRDGTNVMEIESKATGAPDIETIIPDYGSGGGYKPIQERNFFTIKPIINPIDKPTQGKYTGFAQAKLNISNKSIVVGNTSKASNINTTNKLKKKQDPSTLIPNKSIASFFNRK